MATLAEIRQQYPQYDDLSDEQLARAFHGKFYSDMPYREFAGKIGVPTTGGPQTRYSAKNEPAPPTLGDQLIRQGKLAGRAVVNAAAELPLTALEGGAGIGNLVSRAMGGEGNVSFRRQWEEGLNAATAKPEGFIENATQVATSALVGSKIPAPSVANPAPAGFVGVQTPRQATLAASQASGYVVPPTTANPTAVNKILEGIAGKLTTAQLASAKNQNTTNRLIKQALGLNEDAPLTLEAIQAVRREASEAYRVIRSAGPMQADEQFNAALARIEAVSKGAEKSFPGLAKNPVADDLAALRQPTFEADSAVDAIKVLRDNADEAFRQGKTTAGRAYRDMAKALEEVIERNLVARGDDGAAILEQFRKGREAIAKTYSVEKAFNQSTGNVDATKLARELAKGKPLSGEIRQVAQFGQAFPKAARDFNESLPGISPLDFYASGGTAALAQKPSLLTLPFIRQGVRQGMLTPWAQEMLTQPKAGAGFANMGAPNALLTLQNSLIGQK